MAQKKTLQVKEERPAEVEAVLTASPILADMELFTVGDQSQMHVMKRWIETSTVPCGPCRGGVGQCKETRVDAS